MKHSDTNKYAARYAKALFELACESGSVEKIINDINDLDSILVETPTVLEMLSSVFQSNEKRTEIIDIISKKAQLQKITQHCLMIMARNKRLELLPAFVDAFKRMYQESKNIKTIDVVSATELTPANKKELSAVFKKEGGFDTIINAVTNPSLLGGLVITYQSQQFDDSIKTKLERLKRTMKGTA